VIPANPVKNGFKVCPEFLGSDRFHVFLLLNFILMSSRTGSKIFRIRIREGLISVPAAGKRFPMTPEEETAGASPVVT
jgi:hypothetical protein